MTPEEIEYYATEHFNIEKPKLNSFSDVISLMKSIQQRETMGKIMQRYHTNWSKADLERSKLVLQLEQTFHLNCCKDFYQKNKDIIGDLKIDENDKQYLECLGKLLNDDFYHELDEILDEESYD